MTIKKDTKMITVNHSVFIQEGEIIGNPFKNKKVYSDTVFWILENRIKVEMSIRFWIGHFGLTSRGVNVDDCFHTTLEYFINDESLDFDADYFKEDTPIPLVKEVTENESEYNILSYIHRYTRYAMHNWLSDNKHNSNSSELKKDSLTTGGDTYFASEFVLDIENEKLNTRFLLLAKYKDYFISKGFIDFNFLEFIGYYFFDVEDEDSKVKNSLIIKNQCKRTAKKMNVSFELIQLIVDSIKKDFNLGVPTLIELFNELEYLIKESSGGWKPSIIEGDNDMIGGVDLWDMK